MIVAPTTVDCNLYSIDGNTLLYPHKNLPINVDFVVKIRDSVKEHKSVDRTLNGWTFDIEFVLNDNKEKVPLLWCYLTKAERDTDLARVSNSVNTNSPIIDTISAQQTTSYQNDLLIYAQIKQVFLDGLYLYPTIDYTFDNQTGAITGAFQISQNIAIFI